ncbi:hypothetical protein F9802_02675 [Bacillus aerolatus]|uniref:Uncharacterized protein n=1 Tax=Bacillus aerolatus TaxID=2653354 RepID=A0A6I1FP87_9BACI|nr:hypothetical protein [Bacillus aerolatus]KAB7709051.1 hypothetical protein F9802_02675 [Bacillus aerolatus]
MKSYLKLVNFEVNRFFKMYLILIGITILSQIIGSFAVSKRYMNEANRMIYENLMPKSQFIEQFGGLSFSKIVFSGWFMLPIVLCSATLMIYVFFIWYRDWFGKNTFIYRLLMLPVERINIYFAKLTAIMFFVLGFIALQILLIPIEMHILKSIVPADFRTDLPFHEIFNLSLMVWLYPNTIIEFILIYGIGLIFVSVVFTAILLERSYRLKGVFLASVYGILSFIVFFAPASLDIFFARGYFYPIEIFVMELVTGVIVLVSAIWIANHLLKYKIKV